MVSNHFNGLNLPSFIYLSYNLLNFYIVECDTSVIYLNAFTGGAGVVVIKSWQHLSVGT